MLVYRKDAAFCEVNISNGWVERGKCVTIWRDIRITGEGAPEYWNCPIDSWYWELSIFGSYKLASFLKLSII